MKEQINMVGDFQKAFNAPILETPTIPNSDRCELRINLIQEELNEIKDGISANDLVEVADGLGDILYVVYGMILEFGLQDKITDVFNEVHRSNMSKACESTEEAIATQEHYFALSPDNRSYVVERDGKFYVYRQSDNKALKSINYSPANIKSLL